MKVNKWVAVLATCSMLTLAVPVVAQFGGLKSLKKAMDTVAKELEKPKPAPQPQPAAAAAPEAPAPQEVPKVAKPRDILKGQWVPIADSCTPPGMVSDAVIEIGESEEGENLSRAYSYCSFPRNGIIGTSDYSGKMSCASEGFEGTPDVRLNVTESGLLVAAFSAYVTMFEGEDPQKVEASTDTYKRCPKKISTDGG
jgi:hypothetical protein